MCLNTGSKEPYLFILLLLIPLRLDAGQDFSGEPGSLAPRKSLKLTGNPCWNSQFLHFKKNCYLVFLSIRKKFLFIRIISCKFKKIYTYTYIFSHFLRFLLIQFQAKYPADPVGSHEAKIKSHPAPRDQHEGLKCCLEQLWPTHTSYLVPGNSLPWLGFK